MARNGKSALHSLILKKVEDFKSKLAFKSPSLIFSDAPIKLIIGLVSLEAKLIAIIIDKKSSNVTIST